MWLDGILGKVCSLRSHSVDHRWGQIPHGAERKPAGVCTASSAAECFTSNAHSWDFSSLSESIYPSTSIHLSSVHRFRSFLLCLARFSVLEITSVYQPG